MDDQATTEQNELLSVERAIKEHIVQIEKLKEETQPQKEMLESYIENNETYKKVADIAKKAATEKGKIKKELLKNPTQAAIVEKLKEAKEEAKGLQEALSYYLREYQRLTGANEFEGEDGELRQIVYVAKLVRKTNLEK
jgi:ribosomal 50S subunit-associated protein YjgA (DUF615 family)